MPKPKKRPKPKPPRAVRAWAIADGRGKFSTAPYLFIKTTKPHRSVAGNGERIVRVTVSPDGEVCGAVAEVRRLRKALREVRKSVAGYIWTGGTRHMLVTQIDAALRRRG